MGAITAPAGCANPKFLQTYFYAPEAQKRHRATRSAGTGHSSTYYNQNMDEEIFEILRRILVDVCCHVYLMSFYTTEEYLRLNNISPESVQIELVEENVPFSG